MEDVKEFLEEVEKEPATLPRKSKNNRVEYKSKVCPVVSYDSKMLKLILNFCGYNISFSNVKYHQGDTVSVKYKGTIGKPNFEIKL